MASDNIRQVGRYIRDTNRNANYAIKRYTKKLPIRDRVRDSVSTISPFVTYVETDGSQSVTIDINFSEPPPSTCDSECIATTCEEFELSNGGHSILVVNPFEAGTVKIYSNGNVLDGAQWYESNPLTGEVYVQVQSGTEMIVICYAYIIC